MSKKETKVVDVAEVTPPPIPINEALAQLWAAQTVQEMKSALSQMTREQVQSEQVQAEIRRIVGG